jgi:hypothetical protein
VLVLDEYNVELDNIDQDHVVFVMRALRLIVVGQTFELTLVTESARNGQRLYAPPAQVRASALQFVCIARGECEPAARCRQFASQEQTQCTATSGYECDLPVQCWARVPAATRQLTAPSPAARRA